MKYLSVLVLAIAFGVSSSAEAGCRGGLFGGRLRGSSCGTTSCKSSCGDSCGSRVKLFQSRSSCSSSGCATPAKAEAAKGAEKPKAAAPSTK